MSFVLIATNRQHIYDWLRQNPTERELFMVYRPDIVENFKLSDVGRDFLERAEIIFLCDPLHYLQDYGNSHYLMLAQFLWYCQSIGAKIDSSYDVDMQYWINLANDTAWYLESYFREY